MECSLLVNSVSVKPENRGLLEVTFTTSTEDLLALVEDNIDIEDIKEKFNLIEADEDDDDE